MQPRSPHTLTARGGGPATKQKIFSTMTDTRDAGCRDASAHAHRNNGIGLNHCHAHGTVLWSTNSLQNVTKVSLGVGWGVGVAGLMAAGAHRRANGRWARGHAGGQPAEPGARLGSSLHRPPHPHSV